MEPRCNPLGTLEGMLPNSINSPAKTAQFPPDFRVTSFVPCDLRCPIFTAGLWHPAVAWATVPKTSVNEQCQARTRKNEIRSAWQIRTASPAPDSLGAKDRDDLKFGCPISMRTNRRHDLRPFRLGDHVGHSDARIFIWARPLQRYLSNALVDISRNAAPIGTLHLAITAFDLVLTMKIS